MGTQRTDILVKIKKASLELQELSPKNKESALKDMIDKILTDEPKDFWNQ